MVFELRKLHKRVEIERDRPRLHLLRQQEIRGKLVQAITLLFGMGTALKIRTGFG